MSLLKSLFAAVVLLCLSQLFNYCKTKDNKHYPEISKDSLVFSFVTVGCNREDKKDMDSSNPSTANVAQLTRTFEEVASLNPRPDYFFFTGDMIFGYAKDDTAKLDKEMKAWRKLYESSPLAKTNTKFVAIPGNHELLYSKKAGGASLLAEKAWARVMMPYIAGSNGPKPGGKDSVNTDESRLTYSFDYKGGHFVILNTDEVGLETEVNNYWIADDISKARASGSKKHICVFTHPGLCAP